MYITSLLSFDRGTDEMIDDYKVFSKDCMIQ